MSQGAASTLAFSQAQRACFDSNLTALEARQSDVARIVRATDIPAGVRPVTGRDGTSTAQVPGDHGGPIWFGQSSMPSISAPAAFADMSYHGGNAALPGVLTGLEPLTLLERLPQCAALFVLEDAPLNVAIAMHLYDYTESIGSGRLVFVFADDFGANLTAYIRRYPGYDLPTQLYHVPQRSSSELSDLRRRLELESREAVDHQRELIDELIEALRGRSYGLLSESPRVAVVSADAQPSALEHTRRITRALGALGWAHGVCAPDTPQQCHVLARLRAIVECDADLVIVVNHGTAPLVSALPPELPVVSWWFEPIADNGAPTIEARPFDVVVVTRSALDPPSSGENQETNGALRCEPAGDGVLFCAGTNPVQPEDESTVDVLVPVDLPDDRAEACGVALASHVGLWNAVLRIVRERVDRPEAPDPRAVLADAVKATGVPLGDSGVRAHFVELIGDRAIPAARARSLVDACRHVGLRVAVCGSNWHGLEGDDVAWRGLIPHGEALHRLIVETGVVALPSCDASCVQHALDALLVGTPVCLRARRDEFERCYPGLVGLPDDLALEATSRKLATRAADFCRRQSVECFGAPYQGERNKRNRSAGDQIDSNDCVPADPVERSRGLKPAAQNVTPQRVFLSHTGVLEKKMTLVDHTVTRRLEWIAEQVRARQTGATSPVSRSV